MLYNFHIMKNQYTCTADERDKNLQVFYYVYDTYRCEIRWNANLKYKIIMSCALYEYIEMTFEDSNCICLINLMFLVRPPIKFPMSVNDSYPNANQFQKCFLKMTKTQMWKRCILKLSMTQIQFDNHFFFLLI